MGTLDDLIDPGDVAADQGGAGFIEEPLDGKHVVIGVEHFAPEVAPTMMNSYLRLGTPLPADKRGRASGDDLAQLVQGFTDDTRDRGKRTETQLAPDQSVADTSAALFKLTHPGDHRPLTSTDPASKDPLRPPDALGQMRMESAILHDKGGWRDHTDGNRITTTRGDKVEVIQGNYKLLVLGRQDNDGVAAIADAAQQRSAKRALLDNSAGFDISGGQNDLPGNLAYGCEPDVADPANPTGVSPDASRTGPLAVAFGWAPDSDGRWSWTQTTNVGKEHPGPEDRGNYRIINYNYVDYWEDNYGTEDGRVSKVVATTYAKGMDTAMHVSGTNKTRIAGGTVESGNKAAWILTHNAIAGMSEVDLATTLFTIQLAGAIGTACFGGVATVGGVVCDLHLGPHIDGHIGPHIDTHQGIHTETHFGTHLDVHLDTHTDLQVMGHVKDEEHEARVTTSLYANGKWTVNMKTGEVKVTTAGTDTTAAPKQCVQINANGTKTLGVVTKS